MASQFFDAHRVRYKLAASNAGEALNWIFIPGGPGADSCYFESLIDLLKLPGDTWLIDFPGSGSNIEKVPADFNFDAWFDLFLPMVSQFKNAILVGQSFGGMFPLLFPALEERLKGFVILNSSPTLWLHEAMEYSRQFDLPDLSREMQEFTLNPSQETFEKALDACMPYYFPKETLEMGRSLLKQVPFQYLPAVWWQRKAVELNFDAKWVPEKVPTLIINSTHDCICPYTLFHQDARFQRPNIQMSLIKDAGHMPWLEKPEEVRSEFQKFQDRLLASSA
ncbi:MAG: alpha/beta hydrolase [Verrucomicrobia bacterium]|nr:alpha/beta hydrolase [Verrucomicrobiota bacterium]